MRVRHAPSSILSTCHFHCVRLYLCLVLLRLDGLFGNRSWIQHSFLVVPSHSCSHLRYSSFSWLANSLIPGCADDAGTPLRLRNVCSGRCGPLLLRTCDGGWTGRDGSLFADATAVNSAVVVPSEAVCRRPHRRCHPTCCGATSAFFYTSYRLRGFSLLTCLPLCAPAAMLRTLPPTTTRYAA